MAELPEDDIRLTRRSQSLSEPVRRNASSNSSWKEALWKTYYTVKSKVSTKYVEIDDNSEVWLLGVCYDATVTTTPLADEDKHRDVPPPHIAAFLQHAASIIWMTYRFRFPPLANTTMTTDCGWGCMIRSGQMMLANALNIHLLGRDWRVHTSSACGLRTHRKLLSWFRDGMDLCIPLSLHNLIEVARRHGNQPGQWFGPAQVALMIRDVVGDCKGSVLELANLSVVLASECTVYRQDVLAAMSEEQAVRAGAGDSREQAVLVLIPMRLGVDKLNPIYVSNITFLLSLDQSVGVMGGRPKHSLYFIGYQGSDLVYLDPHIPQSAVSLDKDFETKSYHCQTPRRLPALKMDPSCAFGVYCRNKDDFVDFCQKASKGNAPERQKIAYPFFTIEETRKTHSNHTPYSSSHLSLLPSTQSPHPDSMLESLDGKSLEYKLVAEGNNHSDDDNFVVISTSPP